MMNREQFFLYKLNKFWFGSINLLSYMLKFSFGKVDDFIIN